MEEYNNQQSPQNEIPKSDYSDIGTTEPVKEYSSYKKAKTVSKVTSIVITVVGAGLVLGGVLSFALSTNKVSTEVTTFVVTPDIHEITYEVDIAKSNSNELKIKLHSQFMDVTRNISVGATTGSFQNLTPNMQYEISILEKNTVVVAKTVTTYAEGA